MSNHLEFGEARGALANLQPADKQDREAILHATKATPPYPPIWQLNLVNSNGDGLALLGVRDDLIGYLDRVRAHVERTAD
ncbi:hypothetical protein [Mycolicibacterium aubagnense]|uniref:Uncharacterized protein n=1 Tax=Mycolicibacterium aubagnense TaxID=319707 RepID=A0ABM7I6R9_9MYCO|nr:hypothetical protein [Mycolicibacterium aubagnense]TLH48975.1 hypothetical protein C1S80_29265 [Mycolicibacterium aubagnense]BBX82240.1 hypothetical protein MAUB_01130 [Mycolicibacterium aubagnense]